MARPVTPIARRPIAGPAAGGRPGGLPAARARNLHAFGPLGPAEVSRICLGAVRVCHGIVASGGWRCSRSATSGMWKACAAGRCGRGRSGLPARARAWWWRWWGSAVAAVPTFARKIVPRPPLRLSRRQTVASGGPLQRRRTGARTVAGQAQLNPLAPMPTSDTVNAQTRGRSSHRRAELRREKSARDKQFLGLTRLIRDRSMTVARPPKGLAGRRRRKGRAWLAMARGRVPPCCCPPLPFHLCGWLAHCPWTRSR